MVNMSGLISKPTAREARAENFQHATRTGSEIDQQINVASANQLAHALFNRGFGNMIGAQTVSLRRIGGKIGLRTRCAFGPHFSAARGRAAIHGPPAAGWR